MKTIEIFTGNRAEFGILSPLILELGKTYNINLIISASHLDKRWNTKTEITEKIGHIKTVNMVELDIETNHDNSNYTSLFPSISSQYLNYRKTCATRPEFCLFLGDRIETASYAMTAMYLEDILIHICGGDIINVAGFDTNIKHALTKISHIHLVTNNQSFKVVKQLGEEKWRICNIGMPSLDIINDVKTLSKDELINRFNLNSDKVVIATYHPTQYMPENKILNEFKEMIIGLSQTNCDVILTYPNNDPGYEVIINEIEHNLNIYKNINIIKNLGITNYISLLKNLNVVLTGNSSSILMESAFFKTPSLLLGSRQIGRLKGNNVTELINFTANDVSDFINNSFSKYEQLQKEFEASQFIYGDGNSTNKAIQFINNLFANQSREKILSKHFIILD